MEVQCVGVDLCYSRVDYDYEKPLYQFSFISTVNVCDNEGLPIIDQLKVVGEKVDMFKIGSVYDFYSLNGPVETRRIV